MRYTWDPAKDLQNRQKHLLSLADGIPALEDPNRESWIDDRFDYGEVRIITLGLNERRVLFVVTTEPGEECTRIISVRRAEIYEIEKYEEGRS